MIPLPTLRSWLALATEFAREAVDLPCPFCRVQTRLDLLVDVCEIEAMQGDVACEACCEKLAEEEREEALADEWDRTHREHESYG